MIIENSQQAYFDELFNKTINYGNIIVTEAGITIMHLDGVLQYPTEEEEEQYISQIRNAFENGEIKLNRMQQILLDSYRSKNNMKQR